MHYIEYLPGTLARITTHPTRHGHPDVNRLSREICKFNDWLKHSGATKTSRVVKFVTDFSQYQLQCSS